MNDKVKSLNFTEQQDPDVLEVANEIAELDKRKPHDSIRLLILEAGKSKIAQLLLKSKENLENQEI